jgi:hypothetical protein
MPIEAKCPGCARLLRVPDEYAGKDARCPVCSTVYRVPERALAAVSTAGEQASGGSEAFAEILPTQSEPADDIIAAEDATPPDTSRWFMRTPEGQTFGPASRTELDRWVAEGRVTHDCELRADEGPWKSADLVYPALRVPPAQFVTGPGAPPGANLGSTRLMPHRGGLVLTLALLGFVGSCAILSIMAWVMGNSDLREMREGRMDPGGQSLTQAGYILGMLLSLLWIGAAVVGLFIVLIVAANK